MPRRTPAQGSQRWMSPMASNRGWIGVDLDGTLAEYHGWGKSDSFVPSIGEPVPAMLDRVKQWLLEGKDVRIMTARINPKGRKNSDNPKAVEEYASMMKFKIEAWCLHYIGQVLPITYEKDYMMIELWDDRCVHVELNTGRILG